MNHYSYLSHFNFIHPALCHLIKATELSSKVWLNHEGNDKNRLAFLKEFRTIKCGSTRQSGHTTAVLALCDDRFEHSLCIFASQTQVKMAKGLLDRMEFSHLKFTMSYETAARKLRLDQDFNFEAVVFDPLPFISKYTIDYFYDLFASSSIDSDKMPFFIMMG